MTHVLVAEDDPAVRRAIQRGLSSQGLRVTAVENGTQALEALADGTFDLVVTDINMPSMDGIELLLTLVERGGGLKVIAISGGGRLPKEELLSDARLLGAVDILEKPFDLSTLLERIGRALGNA